MFKTNGRNRYILTYSVSLGRTRHTYIIAVPPAGAYGGSLYEVKHGAFLGGGNPTLGFFV